MDDTGKYDRLPKTSFYGLFYGGLVMCVLMVFLWGLYVFNVGTHISHNGKDWSDFGSYFGGVLGPLFSAFTILLVWSQSYLSSKDTNLQIDLLYESLKNKELETFHSTFRSSIDSIQRNLSAIVEGYGDPFDGKSIKNLIDNGFEKNKNGEWDVSFKWPFIAVPICEIYFILHLLLEYKSRHADFDELPYEDLIYASMEVTDNLRDIVVFLSKDKGYCKYEDVRKYFESTAQ